MKRVVVLCLVMLGLAIPSITTAESRVDHRQMGFQQERFQDQQAREKQQREKVERDKQQRERLERDKHQRARVGQENHERGRLERDRHQRERLERDKHQRERLERDNHQRERLERERRHREQLERNNHQRGRLDRDKHQRDVRLRGRHHDWSHPTYRHNHWRPIPYPTHRNFPFRWHDRIGHYSSNYHVEQIHDRGWHGRFPGLRLFRWADRNGEGFWYRDHQIREAVMFYNDSEELVSIGFFHNGVFVMLRDDDQGYETHDSFFLLRWKS